MVREIADLVAAGDHAFEEMLGRAAEIICETVAAVCIIALLSDDGRRLHPIALGANDPALRGRLDADVGLAWDSAHHLVEPVLRTGHAAVYSPPMLAKAVRDDAAVKVFVDALTVPSAIVVAMRALGKRLGVVGIARQDGFPPTLSEEDAPTLQSVADLLALCVANMHLKEDIDRLRDLHRAASPDPRLRTLTPRELEILRFIGEGLTSREIGERLYLSPRTVEWYRGRLTAKLDVHHRSDLIALGRTLQK